MDQANRAAVITGASSGIGRACAFALASEGWLIFAGVRDEEASAALQQAGNGRIEPVQLDVTDAAQIEAAAATVMQRLDAEAIPGLAGLINNAGFVLAGPLEFTAIDALRRQLEVNVVGQVAVTQAFLPLLRRAQPPGRVVNIGSVSGRVASPLLGPYAMSKHAMEAFSDSLRRELAPQGVHVALLEAGPLATAIWERTVSETEAAMAEAPPEVERLYGPMLTALLGYARNSAQQADPVERAVDAIGHALTAARPRRRYPVGRGVARRLRLLRLLPDAVVDWMLRKRLKRAAPSAGNDG